MVQPRSLLAQLARGREFSALQLVQVNIPPLGMSTPSAHFLCMQISHEEPRTQSDQACKATRRAGLAATIARCVLSLGLSRMTLQRGASAAPAGSSRCGVRVSCVPTRSWPELGDQTPAPWSRCQAGGNFRERRHLLVFAGIEFRARAEARPWRCRFHVVWIGRRGTLKSQTSPRPGLGATATICVGRDAGPWKKQQEGLRVG